MRLNLSELAWRNLVHDRVRLLVTVTGVVFAVVLIVVEFGLFLGFSTTTSGLIDRSRADLWVMSARVPYIEMGVPFSERKLSTVLATPGVRHATKYISRFSQWQRRDGRQENVQVVGFDPDQTLGASGVGDTFEIRGHRVRIAGFTHGIRSFTTSPYVFTSFKNAQNYTTVAE